MKKYLPQTSQRANNLNEATSAFGLLTNFFSENQNAVCDRLQMILRKKENKTGSYGFDDETFAIIDQ